MRRVFGVVITVACFLLPVAGTCAQAQDESSETIVARFGGGEITQAELDAAVGNATLMARQQIYDILKQHVEGLILQELMAAQAEKDGISVEQYIEREITSQLGDPNPVEVQQLLSQFRSRLPSDDAEALARVEDYLRERDAEAKNQEVRGRLFAAADIQILLDVPRAEVPLQDFNPIRGEDSAPITLVEFSDFQCPYCSRVKPTLAKVLEKYGKHMRYAYKHLPLPMHNDAPRAGAASLCADQQDKFWQYHDRLFQNPRDLGRDALLEHAKVLELDQEKFTACLDDPAVAKQVEIDMADADSLGLSGTPAFLINGRAFTGARPFEMFAEIIEDELKRVGIDVAEAGQPGESGE